MLVFFILKEYQKLKQEIDALKMLLKDPIVDQKTKGDKKEKQESVIQGKVFIQAHTCAILYMKS
jgi:hypothetical protein